TRFKNRLQGLLDLAWPEFVGPVQQPPEGDPAGHPSPLAAPGRSPGRQAGPGRPGDPERLARARRRGPPPGAVRVGPDQHRAYDAAPERRLEIEHLFARWDLVRE